MNTRVSYHYADRLDCRQYNSVVVAGTITWEQIEPFLERHHSFIPGQIGLEDLQYRFKLPGADHPWHQIARSDIRPTESAPTITLTGDELAERFAHTAWDLDSGLPSTLLKAMVMESALMPVDEPPRPSPYIKNPAWMRPAGARARKTNRAK